MFEVCTCFDVQLIEMENRMVCLGNDAALRALMYRVIFYVVPKVKANSFFDNQYFLQQLDFFIVV